MELHPPQCLAEASHRRLRGRGPSGEQRTRKFGVITGTNISVDPQLREGAVLLAVDPPVRDDVMITNLI
jgi:hypothetical protein